MIKKNNFLKYYWEGGIFIRCGQKNDGCGYLYNKNKKYCDYEYLIKSENQNDLRERMRWECLRYESIKTLQQYHNISFGDNPIAFTDYTWNLTKIIPQEYKRKSNTMDIPMGSMVYLSPNNIYIPFDINDTIFDVTIKLDKHNRVISPNKTLATFFYRRQALLLIL